jgi:hypothetical protein
MATFPALIPSEAPIVPGTWPTTAHKSLNGAESRIRHGSAPIGGRWSPAFVNITEADYLAILSHYRGQRSGFDPFGFSATTLAADRTPAGFAWLYAGPPRVVDQHPDCFTVQCEFKCVPRGLVVVSGKAWRTGATTLTVGTRDGGIVYGPTVAFVTSSTTLTVGARYAAPYLVAWWDTSDSAARTVVSGNVSQLDDKSGNGWHLSQSDASLRPALAAASINGLDAMEWPSTAGGGFGGGNAKRLFTSRSDVFIAGEVYAVVKYTGEDLNGSPGLFNANDNGSSQWIGGVFAANSFATSTFNQFFLNGGSSDQNGSLLPTMASTCLIRARLSSGGIVSTTSGVALGMDRDYGFFERGWRGFICEVRVYSEPLSPGDRSTVINSMRNNKWATPIVADGVAWVTSFSTFTPGG